jgi:hypothetical protein
MKWQCNIEGCDCLHCRRCGRHYEPCRETESRGGICDRCIIGDASDEMEAITRSFNGNYEEAAKFMGW